MNAESKLITTEQPSAIIDFPILMKSTTSGLVILFTSRFVGVVMLGCEGDRFGTLNINLADAADNTLWVPFTGVIEIKNKQ